MKNKTVKPLFPFLLLLILLTFFSCQSTGAKKLNIFIITGGHNFERQAFFGMFDSFPDITYTELQQPDANNYYTPDKAKDADVFVFYDMVQDISEPQKAAFLDLLNKGKGMVFLHHSFISYQDWPEFEQVTGGKYFLEATMKDGQEIPASTYKHDVNFDLTVVDPEHPVTKGLRDFTIHDEVYGGYTVLPDVEPLLTTNHPESSEIIAWAKSYGNSRIVVIQPGHDSHGYSNPNYQQLVKQAIEWVAGE